MYVWQRAVALARSPAVDEPGIVWTAFDLIASDRAVDDTMLPHATQLAESFHSVQLANRALDEFRV